jgi:cobaltochelatase CobT
MATVAEAHPAPAGVAAATRRQQRIDELCAAAIRALAADPALQLRGRRLWRGATLLPRCGPHLEPSAEAGDDFGSFRGAADGMALRQAWSDAALHRCRVPADRTERWVFELLEQLRCDSFADLPGVRANLRHRFVAWSQAFHASGLADTDRGLLLYTLAQIVRSRVGGEPVVEATEDLIEATRAAIVPEIGTALAGLRRTRRDQAAYAGHALAIARWAAASLAAAGDGAGRAQRGEDADTDAARDARFALWTDFDADADDGIAQVASGDSRVFADAGRAYRVFSTAYDREQRAGVGIRRALLDEYRAQIDRRIAEQGLNAARLARELQALLAVPVRDGWDDGEEEGRIDARRLAQLVASPAERRLFRRERTLPQADCAVAILIDCSGSMRGPIESVALLADLLARAVEGAGADCELLGFTTGDWNGGRARRDWQRAGRPRHPGRLAERCHLVFKDADTPWSRARRDIAALLKADRFREGIDGEAVDWACERLLARDVARRLLWVVSDGSPMDGATALANDAHYLDHHLRDVVARRVAEGAVEIGGIGVGLDLGPYYPRSVALDPEAGIGNAILVEIVRGLAGRRR